MTQSQHHPHSVAHIWKGDEALLVRVGRIIRHPSGLRLIKYSAVSIISTVVSQFTLLMTFGIFHVVSEVPANIIANLTATVPSYTLNRRWVWGKGGKSHLMREVVPFWTLSFVGLGVSSVAVWGAGAFARHHHLHHFGTSVLVNGANLLSFGALWILKFIIFNKLFHTAPIELAPPDEDLVEA